jgi:hypothetical protein
MRSVYIRDGKLNILVLGYIVRGPIAGMTWHHIQYVMGLMALGHKISYYESSGESIYCNYNPTTGITDNSPDYGLSYLTKLIARLDLNIDWSYYDFHNQSWYGSECTNSFERFRDYDMLINLSASNHLNDWMLDIPVRVLVDTDPVFTQIRNMQDPQRRILIEQHNVFMTFGENINSPTSAMPSDGIDWQPTRQPVVLDLWENPCINHIGRFTNIMQWESYAPVAHGGTTYGVKSHSFGPYLDLPGKTKEMLEIALGSSNAPRQVLRDNKWNLINPIDISKDPWEYKSYIQHSKAEFSIAKEAYVKSRSGWFSERSACYLASSRPVITQDTGFSSFINSGSGLLAFNSPIQALEAIEMINVDYMYHCRKAREIAVDYFDSRKVLNELIEHAMGKTYVR